mmetsp:Transcript_19979/g.30417  ORF Transcript_19979/g.30417 Transcript_19979/m.30417 type:complete len:385 (-) Transcript_19979:66-1220(-)
MKLSAFIFRLLFLRRQIVVGIEEGCSDRTCGRFCNSKRNCFIAEKCRNVGRACELGKKAIKEEIWKEALTQVAKVQLPSREKPFQSCAVVSSSEILLKHKFGGEIDAYDKVIRINMSPILGFEPYVGSRTDIAVTNTPSWSNDPKNKKFVNVTNLLKAQTHKHASFNIIIQDALTVNDSIKCCFKGTAKNFRVKVKRSLEACQNLISNMPLAHGASCSKLDASILDAAWRLICAVAKADPKAHCHYSPSSGLTSILYALSQCSSVRLFGFGLGPSRGHYYATDRKLAFEVKPEIEDIIFRAWSFSRHDTNLTIAGLPPTITTIPPTGEQSQQGVNSNLPRSVSHQQLARSHQRHYQIPREDLEVADTFFFHLKNNQQKQQQGDI